MQNYQVITNKKTILKTERYLENIRKGEIELGVFLKREWLKVNQNSISTKEFLKLLINTKHTQIFAEYSVYGDGNDWNSFELSILGDISIFVSVTIFDDGTHYSPNTHNQPFSGNLIYVPGALLENGTGNVPVDLPEVLINGEFSFNRYYNLYIRRLLPCLFYINQRAMKNNHKAFITVPGIGCGQFAGQFSHRLATDFNNVLKSIIETHFKDLTFIKAIYYDPFNMGDNYREDIGHINYFVRPLQKANHLKAQLCYPTHYQEQGDDFSDCQLYSVVAWDHVSWPGNDFYSGSRQTDDGVKAAATNSMFKITGIKGEYDKTSNCYLPPKPYLNWSDVVQKNKISLNFDGIYIYE